MSGYRTYPAYKPSGIDWLGDVPEHWDASSVRHHFDLQLGKMLQNTPLSMEDLEVPYLKAVHVNWERATTNDLPKMWASPRDVQQFGVKPGDLLVCEGGEAGRAAILGEVPQPCIIQNALHRVRAKNSFSAAFLLYFLEAVAKSGWLDVICNRATIVHFTSDKLGSLRIAIPPPNEQADIAAFLDRETFRIDAAIGRYERLIVLLGEKRQALISHAVTKGLDPDAPVKDSGVEWLGEIPAHWRVLKLGLISREIQTGPFGSQLHAEDYVQDGVPIVNPANIQAGTIMPDYSCTVDESTRKRLARHVLHSGDIVFGRRGEMGRCALVTEREAGWLCGTGSLKVRLDPQLADPQYLSVVLRTSGVRDWLLLQSVGSTMENLNTTILSRLSVPVPPLVEQEAIHAFLLHRQEIIQTLTAKAQKAIDLLREHRTSLISAAVTGKIDVQSTVAPLVCAHL